jgi:predicted permease
MPLVSLLEDARYALRGLRRDPFLAVTATATLALCIGANTAVFSIADSILIRPLPYPSAERIDWISERSGPNQEDIGTAPDYYRLRDSNRIFESVAEFNAFTANWTGVERPELFDAAMVSPSFFRVLATPPLLGRYLAPDEEGSKAPAVAVLSYAFWRNRLGSDTHIVGKTVALDRLPRTIIGVMPQGFDFPRGAQIWLPSPIDEADARIISPTRPIFGVSIIARRKPGLSAQQVETEMNRVTYAIRPEYQVFHDTRFRSDLVISAHSLQEHLTGPLRPALLVLTGAVGLVLLIACVNLANLLLARVGSRQRELAVRLALGSNRGRIVRQMLTESLVLALPGGIAGIAIAWLAVDLLNATKPAVLVRYPPISIDLRVLAFTLALTLATSLLFGLAPAISAASIRIQETLKSSSLTHSAGRAATRVRKLLLVAELAISLVLLIGAGLLVRSFLHLMHTELGFRTDHLMTFRVNPIGPFERDYTRFYTAVLDRLKQLPMARSVALLTDMPLNDEDFFINGRIRVVGRPLVPFAERPIINNTLVSAGFFQTLEIPLKSGRTFDTQDSAPAGASVTNYGARSGAPVVVNEAFVGRLFPGENPVGRQIVFGPDRNSATWTIIGIVGNVRGPALGADPPAMVYRCACDGSRVFHAGFMVRTAGDPKSAIRAVEASVRGVDRDQPIFDVKTMDERRDVALAPERFQLILIGTFAALAILLAAAGVFGVMSYLVGRRTREIGIRMALGARPADVLRSLVAESVVLVIAATVLGLAGAWGLTRYIKSMLYGVTEVDFITFALTPLLLCATILAASFAPARRAARIDPATALREE